MNDLFDLVRELEPIVPTLEATQIERQRAKLNAAVGMEVDRERTGSSAGESVKPAFRRNHRQGVALVGGAVAATVAALVVALVVVVPGPGRPPSAAAAVLEQAAAAVSAASPGPGQYLYTETQTTYREADYRPSPTAGEPVEVATASFGETEQSWTDAAGNGHVVRTYGTLQFPSGGDEAAWKALNGQGGLEGQMGMRMAMNAAATAARAHAIDVSSLPTEPTALASVLASGQMGTAQQVPAGPDATFERAAWLLIGPTTGMTPTLASALFRVLADQSGTRLLGTVTDHTGQQGEGVAFGGAGAPNVTEVIVDPAQGRLLEADFATPRATTACGATGSCAAGSSVPVWSGSSVPVWSDLVASGIVTSSTATLPTTGSAAITAAQAPSAPTGLVAIAVNGTVALSWTAPSDQGASPVIDYVISATTAGHGRFYLATHSATASYNWPLTSSVTGLAPLDSSFPEGQPLTFAVEAVNATANGPFSATATVTP